jgi:hypothetical protein
VGGRPGGPGPFDQGASGAGVPGVGDRPLPAALPTGLFRGEQAQLVQQLPGGGAARQVAAVGDAGERHRHRHAPEGWERFHNGRKPPRVDVGVECVCPPMEPCGVFGHRPHLFLHDEVRRGGGTHDRAEPTPVRWAPGGPAGLPAIMPEPQGSEAPLGRWQLVERIFTRTAPVTHGFAFDRGNRDRRERT